MRKETKIRDNNIVYDDVGFGDVILLIHGQPFNRSMWNAQTEVLSTGHRLIIPDLRGYGESDITEGIVLLEELALDLIHLLESLGITKAHIVGLSMGGQVALEIYRKLPGLLKSMVLAGTEAKAEDEQGYQNRLQLSAQILKDGMEKFTDDRIRFFMCEHTFHSKPDVVQHVETMMKNTSPQGSAAVQRGRADRPDYTLLLGTINFPVLILVGDQDKFTPLESAQYMNERIEHSILEVIENCGHISNMEQSEAVNKIMARFYGGLHHSI